MVNVGGGPKPELRAILAVAEHDAEIVLAGPEILHLFFKRKVGDAAREHVNCVATSPEIVWEKETNSVEGVVRLWKKI